MKSFICLPHLMTSRGNMCSKAKEIQRYHIRGKVSACVQKLITFLKPKWKYQVL